MPKETKGAAQQPVSPPATGATQTIGVEDVATLTLGVPEPMAITAQPISKPSRTLVAAGYDVSDVGTGFEDFTSLDLAVPFIAILQKGSPQVEDENPKHIDGAKAGMLMNTINNTLYDGKEKGIIVIPVHRVRSFIEWIPKDDGGGLVNVYEPEDPAVLEVIAKAGKKFGKLKINDNNDLVETFNVYCLKKNDDGMFERVVLGFASSQIGPYKKWMTTARSIQVMEEGRIQTPPLFSHTYRMRTEFFQKKDQTWFKWKPGFSGANAAESRIPKGDALFDEAKQFRAMLMAGRVKADYSGVTNEGMAEAEFEM